MCSFKTLVVAILAIFTLPEAIFAQNATTEPVGIIKFASDSHIWYGFAPGKIYLIKAEWPNDKKDGWYLLAFEVKNIMVTPGQNGSMVAYQVDDQPVITKSHAKMPPISPDYDGTVTTDHSGTVHLYNMSSGKKTPLIQLKVN